MLYSQISIHDNSDMYSVFLTLEDYFQDRIFSAILLFIGQAVIISVTSDCM